MNTEEERTIVELLHSQPSTLYPQKHVWIDTDLEGISIDLEDRAIEGEWDNAVARLTVQTFTEAAGIVHAWLPER